MMSKRVFLKRKRCRFCRPSCKDCVGEGYTAAQLNSPPPPATAPLSASILKLGSSPAGAAPMSESYQQTHLCEMSTDAI